MSDTKFAEYQAKHARAEARTSEIFPQNRSVLFDALTTAGILLVTIGFDGSCDSGQLEIPVAFDATNTEVDIPPAELIVKVVEFETGTVREQTKTVKEFIEELAYDLLEKKHDGWENGEGAHGEFRFSTAEQTIILDYNERYIEHEHYEYEF